MPRVYKLQVPTIGTLKKLAGKIAIMNQEAKIKLPFIFNQEQEKLLTLILQGKKVIVLKRQTSRNLYCCLPN